MCSIFYKPLMFFLFGSAAQEDAKHRAGVSSALLMGKGSCRDAAS